MSESNELQVIRERLQQLETEAQLTKARAARQRKLLGLAVTVLLFGGGLLAGRNAFAQVLCTYTGLNAALRPFCADTPALADDLNFNNKKLTDFIEQKVGTVGSPNLTISGSSSYGNRTAQHLNLWGTEFGIGIQSGTLYQRSNANFAWHLGGVHNDNSIDPGGGSNLMYLNGQQLRVNVPINTTSAVSTGALSASSLTASSLNVSGSATLGAVTASSLNVTGGVGASLEARTASAGGANGVTVTCSSGKRIVYAIGWTNDNNSACDVGNRQTRCQVPIVLNGCVGQSSCSHNGAGNGCGNPGNTCLYATCL